MPPAFQGSELGVLSSYNIPDAGALRMLLVRQVAPDFANFAVCPLPAVTVLFVWTGTLRW
jgi:hypothetical protein